LYAIWKNEHLIILIPILIYIVFTIALISRVSFLLKRKDKFIRTRVKKWIIGSTVNLFFPLGLLYLSYLFGLALDNHYDVKKGTFLWYATTNNGTITDFPVFESVGKVTYNSIGGDLLHRIFSKTFFWNWPWLVRDWIWKWKGKNY